jgi:hypothetical protein
MNFAASKYPSPEATVFTESHNAPWASQALIGSSPHKADRAIHLTYRFRQYGGRVKRRTQLAFMNANHGEVEEVVADAVHMKDTRTGMILSAEITNLTRMRRKYGCSTQCATHEF